MHQSANPVALHELGAGDWTGASHMPPLSAVRLAVIASAVAIVLLGCLREWLRLGYGVEGTSFFNLNREQNIGAWFSATLLAAIALMLFNAGRRARSANAPLAWYWSVLTLTFVALSIDEASSVHEMVMAVLSRTWHTGGLLKYAWVIPALVLVPLFALASVPFLLRLPRRIAALFVAAGAVFVTGALGFELLEGLTDGRGVTFVVLYLVEESLEIAASVSFFLTLAEYLATPEWAQGKEAVDALILPER